MQELIGNITVVLEVGSQVIGAAAVVASIIPKAQNAVPVLKGIRQVIDFLAFNFGNAKNK